jgi:predicted DNA-binding protein
VIEKRDDEKGGTYFNFRVSLELKKWIDEKAERLGLSSGEFVREIVTFIRKMDG